MDEHTWYTAKYICRSMALQKAVEAFEAARLSSFWSPETVRADQAFQEGHVLDYTQSMEFSLDQSHLEDTLKTC